MAKWRNNGGWNKSHGTVEKTPRVDSFEAGAVEGWGCLFGYVDNGIYLVLECARYTEYGPGPKKEREIVEVWYPKEGWSQTLELSRKKNGFGGSQTFFLCPACGERRRYLYQVGATFLCRKCARLNYRSQQETRSDMWGYFKGMDYAEKHFEGLYRPDGFAFPYFEPDKRKGQHWSTYRQQLVQFKKYQLQYTAQLARNIARIAGRFK